MPLHPTRASGTILSASIYNSDFLTGEAAVTGVTNAPRVQGLRGVNTPSFTTTRFDLQADWILFKHATGADLPVLLAQPTTLTCNLGLAGPIANGRDQLVSFTGPTWVYLYFIWNGSVKATTASLVPPPTGPILPTGYTHWALATTLLILTGVGGPIVQCFARGSWVYFREAQAVAFAAFTSTPGSPVTVNHSGFAPPHALAALLMAQLRVDPGSIVSPVEWQLRIGPPGATSSYLYANVWCLPSFAAMNAVSGVMPNVGQQYIYQPVQISGPAGSTASLNIHQTGYSVPNGGE